MKTRNIALAAIALALALGTMTIPAAAQGPLYDQVNVSLPYSVTIGDRTLQPGDYWIRQLPSAGSSRVLLIYSDKGMKFETSAMTIPALENRTPEDTKIVLHHFGPDYYFDKIWIQGKDYGYEFPLPDSVKARQRERMEPMSVAARYQSVPAEAETSAAQNTTPAPAETTTTAQNTTPAPAETTPAPAETNPTPAETTTTAQNTTPAPVDTTPSATTTTSTTTAADRTMPATAGNWMMMLLGGGLLSGAGLSLRRKL